MFLLEMVNNIIQYQFEGNAMLIYSVLRQRDCFHRLLNLSLPSNLPERVGSCGTSEALTEQEEDTCGIDLQQDQTAEKSTQQQEEQGSQDVPETEGAIIAEESSQQQEEQGSQDAPETEGAILAQSTPEEPSPWVPTQAWLNDVKKKLPLQAVLCLVNYLGPKIEAIARKHDITAHDEAIKYIRQTTMVGILPVPHPISIRTYQASNYTSMWFTSYMWGVIFSRSQRMPMYDWTKIRLVAIGQ